MVLDLIGTWSGLGLGDFGARGLGTELENYGCGVGNVYLKVVDESWNKSLNHFLAPTGAQKVALSVCLSVCL